MWGEIMNHEEPPALEYPFCSSLESATSQQTPIDLPAVADWSAQPPSWLDSTIAATAFQIVSRPAGHPGFQVKPAAGQPASNFTVDGEVFQFLQLHFHAPSEHTVDGFRFPLEVHFVHQRWGSSGTDDLAVIGILFNYSSDGTHNPALDSFWNEIFHPLASFTGLNLHDMMWNIPGFQRYSGSLTTPPCAENVKWHVGISTVGINVLQSLSFTYALNGIQNYRDIQPLNGRVISALQMSD